MITPKESICYFCCKNAKALYYINEKRTDRYSHMYFKKNKMRPIYTSYNNLFVNLYVRKHRFVANDYELCKDCYINSYFKNHNLPIKIRT